MRHYCTLSDRNYLGKLLVLHESLLKHSTEEFALHILALDQATSDILYELQLSNVEVMPLGHVEYMMHLEPIRASRTWQEYAWTLASSWMEFLMPWVGDVTYLDADLMFFSDPKAVFDEIGDRSIGITPHRFPSHRKHMEVNGVYNVGLVHAKNTDNGRQCITRWAKQVREWCFNRIEGQNACGDQKYLDSWATDYPGDVCAIENIGVNLAPWNIERYHISEGPKVDGWPVVFYHVHEFKNERFLTGYGLRPEDREFIYAPYIERWKAANVRIAEMEARLEESRKRMELEAQRA